MSQRKIRTYINIASFKLNKISLLKQSKFNPSLNNMFRKNSNINILPKERIKRINPLAKKDKIIKRHNILQQIDFHVTTNKTNFPKKYNNINRNLDIISTKTSSPRNIFKNKKIQLPILLYNNYNKLLKNSKNHKRGNSNRINLQKNIDIKNSISFTFNPIIQKNNLINASNYINNAPKILKPNRTDKEIQTYDDLTTMNNENKNILNNDNINNILNKIKIKDEFIQNEKNEEDSSDDFDYKKEIEKIISNKPEIKNFSEITSILSNNKKLNMNKKNNYILLESLYKLKNFKNDNCYNTELNSKMTPIKNKKNEQNIYSKINIIHIKKNSSQRQQKMINIKQTHKKILPKNFIYNIFNNSLESKIEKSRRSVIY